MISPRVNILSHVRPEPYSFLVTATDAGTPPLTGDTVVDIYIRNTEIVGGEPQILDPATENEEFRISEVKC